MSLFDANCFLGRWPFQLGRELTAAELTRHLARCGVNRAAVSPLDAAFQPEPMPANRRLFSAVRSVAELVPVPVVQPVLASWREQLDECRAAGARAIRLMPAYHNYRLGRRGLDAFMQAVGDCGLRLVVTARMEDERGRYFALNIKGLPLTEMAAFLRRFPGHRPLITGLSLGELLKLAGECDNFHSDLAYVEHMALAEMLRGKVAAARLMFGSLAPLYSVSAQRAKLSANRFSVADRRRLGWTNAESFFRCE